MRSNLLQSSFRSKMLAINSHALLLAALLIPYICRCGRHMTFYAAICIFMRLAAQSGDGQAVVIVLDHACHSIKSPAAGMGDNQLLLLDQPLSEHTEVPMGNIQIAAQDVLGNLALPQTANLLQKLPR